MWCASIRTHSRAKWFVGIHDLVDENADDILITVVLGVRGAPQQQISLPFLKSGSKHRNEEKLEYLRLKLLRVLWTGARVHLDKTEEDLPFLSDGVTLWHLVLQVRGEEVEGVNVPVEVDPEQLEQGYDVVGTVLAVAEEGLEEHGTLGPILGVLWGRRCS